MTEAFDLQNMILALQRFGRTTAVSSGSRTTPKWAPGR